VTAHRAALKEYLTFGLGDDAYAVALADVRELVAGHDVAPIAGTSAFIRGCIELRGKPLVVLDPRVELAVPRAADARPSTLLIVRHEAGGAWVTAGLLVDEVFGVARLTDNEIDTSGRNDEARSPMVVGVAAFDGRKLALLELERLWSPTRRAEVVCLTKQLSQLGATTRSSGVTAAERMGGTT